MSVQKYSQVRPEQPLPQSVSLWAEELLRRGAIDSKLNALAEQQAKADAKKAKKQRQKAKKKLTQAQAEALAPHSSKTETTSPPQSSEAGSSELLSLAAQGDSASMGEALAVGAAAGGNAGVTAEPTTAGVTAGVEEDEGDSRQNEDAGMLQIFRCPLSQVSTICLSDGLFALLASVSQNVAGA